LIGLAETLLALAPALLLLLLTLHRSNQPVLSLQKRQNYAHRMFVCVSRWYIAFTSVSL
jgi:hypothetical protein